MEAEFVENRKGPEEECRRDVDLEKISFKKNFSVYRGKCLDKVADL